MTDPAQACGNCKPKKNWLWVGIREIRKELKTWPKWKRTTKHPK